MSKNDEAMAMVSAPGYKPISTFADLRTFLIRVQYKNMRGDYITAWTSYCHSYDKMGLRKGQAFMNALPEELRNKLVGTPIDPYHYENITQVLVALDYLLLSG